MKLHIIFFIFLSINVFGQPQDYQNVNEILSEKEVSEMRGNNPELWNMFLAYSNCEMELFSDYNLEFGPAQELPVIRVRKTGEIISKETFIEAIKSDNFNPVAYSLFPKNYPIVFKISSQLYLKVPGQNELKKSKK